MRGLVAAATIRLMLVVASSGAWQAAAHQYNGTHGAGLPGKEPAVPTVECRLCSLQYVVPDEVAQHRWVHATYTAAVLTLGIAPAGEAGSAECQEIGCQLLGNPRLPVEQRLRGLLMIYRGLYDRSLLAAIRGDRWREHPSLETFLAHVELVERCRRVDDGLAIYAEFRRRYPAAPGVEARRTEWLGQGGPGRRPWR